MEQCEKQFIKDLENERVLKNLNVRDDILQNQKKIKDTRELSILTRSIDNKK